MIQVDEGRAHQHRNQQPKTGGGSVGMLDPDAEKQARGQELHERIAKTVGRTTTASFASQYEPAEYGNVVEPLDRLATGTGRTG